MIARLVTLLPEPDSPTTPSVSPRRSVNERSETAWTTPSRVRKRTDEVADVEKRRVAGDGAHLRVPDARVEEGVDDVDHEVHDRNRGRGDEHHPEHGRKVLGARGR